jgi:exosortase
MLSTDTAVEILKLLHYKVRQEGTIIYLSNIKVMVGTPCSGFRTLISLVAFAVYFAYMKEGPMWGRLTIVAMTAPLSWVANSVRITLIALWGQYFGQEAMMKFHDYSGYIVLLVAFVILWSFAKVVKCEKFKATLFS